MLILTTISKMGIMRRELKVSKFRSATLRITDMIALEVNVKLMKFSNKFDAILHAQVHAVISETITLHMSLSHMQSLM